MNSTGIGGKSATDAHRIEVRTINAEALLYAAHAPALTTATPTASAAEPKSTATTTTASGQRKSLLPDNMQNLRYNGTEETPTLLQVTVARERYCDVGDAGVGISSSGGGDAAVIDLKEVLNDAFSMRRPDDMFGRKITELRRSMTDLDSKPFPTNP